MITASKTKQIYFDHKKEISNGGATIAWRPILRGITEDKSAESQPEIQALNTDTQHNFKISQKKVVSDV